MVLLAGCQISLPGPDAPSASGPATSPAQQQPATVTQPDPTQDSAPDGLEPLVPHHNDAAARRINIVFGAFEAPSGVDWVSASRRMLTWGGPVTQVSDVPSDLPPVPYGVGWGPFAIEPLRSAKDRFTVWYTEQPITDVKGWDRPGRPASGPFPFDLPNRLEVVLVFGTATSGEPPARANFPAFVPPALPASGEDAFGSIVVNVVDPVSLTNQNSAYDRVLSHELGHALFGLQDKYLFDSGSPGPVDGSAYPSCAADQAQAEDFYGDLIGVVDPFVEDYLAAYTQAGIPRSTDDAAAVRQEIVIDYVPDGCFGPAGTARRSSRGGLMYFGDLYDAVERRWAERVLDAWVS